MFICVRSGQDLEKKQLLEDCELNVDFRYCIVLGYTGIGISVETSLKTLEIPLISQKSHTLGVELI